MGAGAWGEFGPIIAISVLLGTKSSFVALLSLIAFGLLALVLAVLPTRLAGDRVRAILERGHHTSSQTALRFTMLLLIVLLALAGVLRPGRRSRRLHRRHHRAPLLATRRGVDPSGPKSRPSDSASSSRCSSWSPVRTSTSTPSSRIPVRSSCSSSTSSSVRGVTQFFLYRNAIPGDAQRAAIRTARRHRPADHRGSHQPSRWPTASWTPATPRPSSARARSPCWCSRLSGRGWYVGSAASTSQEREANTV